MTTVSRKLHLAPHVLFVDGMYGSGKTPVMNILSTFDRVEWWRMEHHYEYICALHHLGKVADDAAEFHMRINLDLCCYNFMNSREVNLRPTDFSSVLNHPAKEKYLARLFLPDGDEAMGRIARERPILQMGTHQVLGIARPLFKALGDRLAFLQVARHPLFMITHWYNYIHRFGTDPREFTVYLDHRGTEVPWFAHGWEEAYVKGSLMDRVILSIAALTKLEEKALKQLSTRERSRLLTIPFERFVRDPEPDLAALERLLGTERTPSTRGALAKERIPRAISNDAPAHPHWQKGHGQAAPGRDSSEETEKEKVWKSVRGEASAASVRALEALCAAYEDRHLRDTR